MKKILVFHLLILALALSACASATPTTAPVATKAPATSASATEAPTNAPPPIATWEPRVMADTSAVANFPTAGKFLQNGTANHYIILKEGGIYEVWDGGFRVASGNYKVAGNVFTETSSDANCGPLGSYTYLFDGTNLTFNYIDDPQQDTCNVRVPNYDNAAYTLVN